MAADLIRVRLHFDYAPPAAVGSRMCWLLVDRGSCRVVADLESLIREKFELSRGSILSLFIDDCYLPHTESVLLVRDNDCVRVKVETVSKSTKQTSPVAASENSRKRQRPAEEDAPVESGLALEFKKKKRKKSAAESPAVNGVPIEVEKMQVSPQKKKKKKAAEEKRKSPQTTPHKPSPSVKKPAKTTEKVVKVTKKPPSSSSSSSSSSEDEQPVKKAPAPKLAPKPAPKTITNGRPPLKKLPPPTSSSSSDTDSSSEGDEDKSVKTKPTKDNSKCETAQTLNIVQASNGADNSNEEEIELVIKKPVQHPRGRIVVGQQAVQLAGRGRGKDKHAPREPWTKGRGRGNCVQYNYDKERAREKVEASYSTDTLTNVSVLFQNGIKSVPKPDYSTMPLLAAPPQVGQKIAFKLLELTDNYTPEVSDYKEAKILSFDPTSKQIELELQTSFQAPVEPGKFDLVYVNADGSESVEYAVDRGSLVTERWDSLLEPRLVI
uniref:Coilin p80 n=1 Tax=Neogobius melanostomus TaxID=47308 RepID=A0A8C6U9U9_9GOBI